MISEACIFVKVFTNKLLRTKLTTYLRTYLRDRQKNKDEEVIGNYDTIGNRGRGKTGKTENGDSP